MLKSIYRFLNEQDVTLVRPQKNNTVLILVVVLVILLIVIGILIWKMKNKKV
ncbi:hypothetical protein P7H46_09950 [Enterococcus pseudoavium]|uniref:LPXTG cell wall anchor domain-containing protein n=1 Tax=Enterococcus pseudoavium TaxID=44007 RepID=A0ABU3FK71_9ENTE|nr:hypothetical protein [Enterococcus pseudoavium]